MKSTITKKDVLGLGLIGAGRFGQFCLEQYAGMDGVEPVAVADAIPEAATSAAAHAQLKALTPEELARFEDVDIVHIATPPSTHHELALAALDAGKHVLLEKPLAVNLNEGREILDKARRLEKIVGVNLIMRYNPLCQCVRDILQEGLIGAPLHTFYENYASDENLPKEHWFWDRTVSGGIFIEHGVHFFDLFEMFFGSGDVVSAQQSTRPGNLSGKAIVEQVQCAVRYKNGVLANFYHGFHQTGRMDRQELRIVCERGSIRLFEWVPTSLEIDAVITHDQLAALKKHIPETKVTETEALPDEAGQLRSRHQSYRADGRYLIKGTLGLPKQEVYGVVLRALLKDQLEAARDDTHRRLVSGENGLRSLEMAIAANRLACG